MNTFLNMYMLVALKRNGKYGVMVPSSSFVFYSLYLSIFCIKTKSDTGYDERTVITWESNFFQNVKKAITYNHCKTLRC